MRIKIIITIFIGAFLACTSVYAENECLSSYRNNNETDWPQVIIDCEKYLKVDRKNANVHIALAHAYHSSKSDFKKALFYYEEASKLNNNFKLAAVPLLDELDEWEKVIKLASSEIKKGNCDPSVMGPLATAYHAIGNRRKEKETVSFLKSCECPSQYEKDYKLYVLSYMALWDNDKDLALSYLGKIGTISFLEYARTAPKFKKLYDSPEFIRLTK